MIASRIRDGGAQLFVLALLALSSACAPSGGAVPRPLVDINPDPLDGFDPGPPPEMRELGWMAGRWSVTTEFRDLYSREERWTTTGTDEVEIRTPFDGAFLMTRYEVPWPGNGGDWSWGLLVSFDRFQRLYRLGVWDDQWALLDVYEADVEGDVLRGSNEETGTWGPGGPDGELVPGHMEIVRESDGFTFKWLGPGVDGGLVPLIRLVHRRP